MDKILVTGVGGGVGQSIVKALQGTSYQTVGVDSEALAAGLHAVPIAYRGAYAVDPLFIPRLLEISRSEKCALLFAGHDAELLPIAENLELFISEGVIPVVSDLSVVQICDDKMKTYNFLKSQGFSAPHTVGLEEADTLDYPVVLKPQHGGARARRTYVANTPKEFQTYRALVDPDNCIVQEYLEGDEYTCGAVSLDGRCVGVIVMRRILRDGDTYKAFVERDSVIEAMVEKIVNVLHPFGACNIQLRLSNGAPTVFEINARCSGTTAARALAGFNEPKMIADYLLYKITPQYTIEKINILRYWKELVVTDERIERLEKTNHLIGKGNKL
jgi:carbamoyl-phosphate synthase large subunit